jgi:hypothetical protein
MASDGGMASDDAMASDEGMASGAGGGGLRAVFSSPDGKITALAGEEVFEFVLTHRGPCLSETDAWSSAVESLRAWCTARLDLRVLRRRGLPVWCAPHRSERSPEPCGRLDARQPH